METLNALFNNAALLFVLSVIYEVTGLLPSKYRHLQPYFSGVLIAIICSAIMLNPFTLKSGIIFDTRSVLISVTALIFGLIPTIITAVTAIIIRIHIGGFGAVTGVAVILSSALIGLAWRKWRLNKSRKWFALSVYVMSLLVHIIMLACMMLLPASERLNTINAIAFPVMLIYPVVTVLLSILLIECLGKSKKTILSMRSAVQISIVHRVKRLTRWLNWRRMKRGIRQSQYMRNLRQFHSFRKLMA